MTLSAECVYCTGKCRSASDGCVARILRHPIECEFVHFVLVDFVIQFVDSIHLRNSCKLIRIHFIFSIAPNKAFCDVFLSLESAVALFGTFYFVF